MCGKARSTANPSKISSIVKNAMARHQAQNKPTDTTEQSNEQSNNDSALEAVDNIVPGMSMYVAYFNEENLLIVEEMKWGLYGFAGKTNGITYNSRIENIGSNFMSKKIKSNRGVVILDGFYEKSGKNSHYISNENNCLIIPILYGVPSYGLNVFTLLTKPADDNIQNIHERQPVIFDDFNLFKWMNMREFNKESIIKNIPEMINVYAPLNDILIESKPKTNTLNKTKTTKTTKTTTSNNTNTNNTITKYFEINKEKETDKLESVATMEIVYNTSTVIINNIEQTIHLIAV